MSRLTMLLSHSTPVREPDESEGAALPVEFDEGLVPVMISDDPEHDRVIDPGD